MNNQTVLETSDTPEVTLEVSSNLVVRGWDRPEVHARSSVEEDLRVQQEDNLIHIHSDSDCDLRVPHGTTLHVAAAHGETTIRDVHGPVTVGEASAKLNLRDVGETRVDIIREAIMARDIRGNLSLGKVGGSANLRNISGDLNAESISGSLRFKGIVGNLTAEVSGNATLKLDQISGDSNLKCYGATKIYLEPQPDQTHIIESYGSLTCRFPDEIDAQINLSSHGPVTVNIGDLSRKEMEGQFTFHFGDSKSTLNLTSYGPVKLVGARDSGGEEAFEVDFDFDFEEQFGELPGDIGERVSAQLEVQMEALEYQLEAQMENLANLMDTAGLSEEVAERIQRRTQEKLARAQEKVRRAQERAARKIAAAQSRAARQAERAARKKRDVHKHIHIPFLSGRDSGASESEPVSEEERMMILNMLAENKISIEEAETLLAALEGRET